MSNVIVNVDMCIEWNKDSSLSEDRSLLLMIFMREKGTHMDM